MSATQHRPAPSRTWAAPLHVLAMADDRARVHDIVSDSDLDALRAHLEAHPEALNLQQAGTGKTPLHVACERGDAETVAFLLAQGANVGLRDRHQLTPLFLAVKRKASAKVVRLLLLRGEERKGGREGNQDDDNKDNEGQDEEDDDEEKGEGAEKRKRNAGGGNSDPNTKGKEGETPLLWAARYGKASVVRALIDAGADVDYCPGRQAGGLQLRTALHCAAASGREDVARLLLECGASLNVVDGEGKTPLFSAVKYNQGAVFEYLVSLPGIDVLHRDTAGRTILHAAAYVPLARVDESMPGLVWCVMHVSEGVHSMAVCSSGLAGI